MNFDKIQQFVQLNGLTQIDRITHSSGAEIFIAEKYSNWHPEFKKPHYQTWMHVSFGEDKPLAGQPLFFNFKNQVSKQSRIAAAVKSAETLIENVVDSYRKDHG